MKKSLSALALFALLSACQPQTIDGNTLSLDETPAVTDEAPADSAVEEEEMEEEAAYPSFTYTNEKYGFSLVLPANWEGYTAVERDDYPTIDFSLKGVSIFAVSMHTEEKWAEMSQEGGPIGQELGRNEDWVFVGSGAQDTGDDVELITARGEVDTVFETFKTL